MAEQKKKRGENWSSEEKEILRQLIGQSAHIIEDKSTKTSINIQKIKEWKNISNKFNEITGKLRSCAEMKLAWKRMKLSAKLNLSSHRREQTKTGGGPKPSSPSPEDLEIMAIAPHDFVIELNDYDSDAVIPVTKPTATATTAEILIDTQSGSGIERNENSIIFINNSEHTIEEVQVNKPKKLAQKTDIDITNDTKAKTKKQKDLKNKYDGMRQSIVDSNVHFKERHLEMMKVEHEYNIKIAKLKIKKLELEIDLLESKRNTN
ncbi:uncharacterized protein LOC135071594 [Ostrinia nubilalis]|uniref:uncharacterized protein LOC135071594 n=2 Tax=Ostrinia nubilalis TaxID=29057 RepID=UPI003082658B